MSLCSRTDLDPGEGHSNLGYNSSHGGSSKAKKWIIANVDNSKKQEKGRGGAGYPCNI